MLKTTILSWKYEIWLTLGSIKHKINKYFYGIKRWISYLPTLTEVVDFDYEGVLILERKQLSRLALNIFYYHTHVDWKRDVQRICLAIKLLDIVMGSGCIELVGKPVTLKDGKVVESSHKWNLPIYVNTNNSYRFMPSAKFEDKEAIILLLKDQLRIEKAWYLYHKLRYYFLRTFWD